MYGVKLSLTAIAATILVQGCGSDTPDDIVKGYIEAWNKGDIQKVIASTDNKLGQKIQENIDGCVTDSMSIDIDLKYLTYKAEVDTAWRGNNPLQHNHALGDKKEEFLPKVKAILEDKTLTKYQGMEKGGELFVSYLDTAEELKKSLSPGGYRFFVILSFKKFLELQGIYSGSLKDILNRVVLDEIKKSDSAKVANTEKECQNRYFGIGEIKEFNIIETKEISADKQEIRVELVKEDGSSKETVDVELINKEWRVTSKL